MGRAHVLMDDIELFPRLDRTSREGHALSGQKRQISGIATGEQGLTYVFVPDVRNMGKQEIDIFSQEGEYLYWGVIELAKGLEEAGSFVVNGEYLYALAQRDGKDIKHIKYRVKHHE